MATLAILLTAIACFFAYSLSASKERYRAEAIESLQSASLNLERYLFARIQSADLVLLSAVQRFQLLSREQPSTVPQFNELLVDLKRWLPGKATLRAANASGLVVYGAGADATQPLSIARRQFYQEASTSAELVIGLPLKSRVSNRWVLPLARQLKDAQGRFGGVVYINVDLEELAGFFASLKTGNQGVITLFNTRREVLLRTPSIAESQDETPVRLTTMQILAALSADQSSGVFETHSSIDQVLRTSMYRKVGTYPAYILVGLANAEFMASWNREAAFTAAFWLALVCAALWLLQVQRRAAIAEAHVVRELEYAGRQASAANQSKTLFLANISHEIRTPLNGVLGFAQIGYQHPGASPEARQHFGQILESGRLLQGILNDLLDMSKIDAGKLLLDEVPTVVRSTAAMALGLVQDSASQKGLDLRLHVSPAVPDIVSADPLRLGQVLLNLLSNAVKFTDRGRVDLRLDAREGSLVIEVHDSGPGISEEQLARMFVPFEQADRTTTRRFGGTGLGLSITKRLAELMGGHIDVSSRVGEGTCFTVRLPLRGASFEPPAPEPQRSPALTAGPKLAGLTLLVAEDNPVNQIVIQTLLETQGARVDLVSDGYQAIERVTAQHDVTYDAVLLDVMMPGIDGYETSRRLRLHDAGLPIIGQTAHALPEDLKNCLLSGMCDRVTKPLDVGKLVDVVLRHARARHAAGSRREPVC